MLCHLTSADSFEWLEDYSRDALVAGMLSHVDNTRMPAFVSGDTGSQIKGAARRVTWSAQSEGQLEEPETTGDCSAMLDTVKRKFKGTSWYIAPSNKQHYNGLVEGNVRVLKGLLLGHLRALNLKNYVFKSRIAMSQCFNKVKSILNNRPLFCSENEVVTVQDIFYPRVIFN